MSLFSRLASAKEYLTWVANISRQRNHANPSPQPEFTVLTYTITARRTGPAAAEARTKDARVVLDTDERDERLSLLHRNVQKFGTIYNTVSAALPLTGTIRRAGGDALRPGPPEDGS